MGDLCCHTEEQGCGLEELQIKENHNDSCMSLSVEITLPTYVRTYVRTYVGRSKMEFSRSVSGANSVSPGDDCGICAAMWMTQGYFCTTLKRRTQQDFTVVCGKQREEGKL